MQNDNFLPVIEKLYVGIGSRPFLNLEKIDFKNQFIWIIKMNFFNNTSCWSFCGDAEVVDGKIVYTPNTQCRGYHPDDTEEEILARERTNKNDTMVLCAIVDIPVDTMIPDECLVVDEHKYSKIRDEFRSEIAQRDAKIDEQNREINNKNRQIYEENRVKVMSILKETCEKLAFSYDIYPETIYDQLFTDRFFETKKFSHLFTNTKDYEDVPYEYYDNRKRLTILLSWNSEEAKYVRNNFKQKRFLDLF
jgi:hypothetical protein